MGQDCCKPYKGSRFKRLSKVKAEADAAAQAARHSDHREPHPTLAQFLENSHDPSTAAPGSEPMSSPLLIPQIDANREMRIEIETNDPQGTTQNLQKSRRRNSREWLQQQRKRLTKSRSFSQLKKNKVALAHDEVIRLGPHPITVVEASTLSREASTNSNGSLEPLPAGGESSVLSPGGPDACQARYEQDPMLLAPTPRRPMATRFPFLNPATVSATTTHSSNDCEENKGMGPSQQNMAQSSQEGEAGHADDGVNVVNSDALPSSAIVALRPREDRDQRSEYGSIHSNAPSIYYLAPSSPQIPPKDSADSLVPKEAHAASPHNSVTLQYGSGIQDSAAGTNESRDNEIEELSEQNGEVHRSEAPGSTAKVDNELDNNFLYAVMTFVASQGPRPQSPSPSHDERRLEVLVAGSGSV
ncbi:uncharacterized protein SPSK_07604 [Sporothrix schenckii 1099-18]|uniref:Uncharacterized protein n=2 Tax=Sporothrix schenckii TaxID=29908 RepID=U7Q0H5_SPOS1|nr:uncharacterized protein SPSK_07604 [Sporothrix schenckii 1099-18]ERT01368.1 hypothetical protein HMPREF1624_02613 [Sporothrix schenckii ATCC 58251]KJR88551.1 hypothetical protein SPSK_07604 [Sporothrix schenckii 1099-18]